MNITQDVNRLTQRIFMRVNTRRRRWTCLVDFQYKNVRLNFATTIITIAMSWDAQLNCFDCFLFNLLWKISCDCHLFWIAIRSTSTNTCTIRYSDKCISMLVCLSVVAELVDTMIHMNFGDTCLPVHTVHILHTYIFKCLARSMSTNTTEI